METINDLKNTHTETSFVKLYDGLLTGDLTLDEKVLLAKIIKLIATKPINLPYVVSSNYHYIDLNDKDLERNF